MVLGLTTVELDPEDQRFIYEQIRGTRQLGIMSLGLTYSVHPRPYCIIDTLVLSGVKEVDFTPTYHCRGRSFRHPRLYFRVRGSVALARPTLGLKWRCPSVVTVVGDPSDETGGSFWVKDPTGSPSGSVNSSNSQYSVVGENRTSDKTSTPLAPSSPVP